MPVFFFPWPWSPGGRLFFPCDRFLFPRGRFFSPCGRFFFPCGPLGAQVPAPRPPGALANGRPRGSAPRRLGAQEPGWSRARAPRGLGAQIVVRLPQASRSLGAWVSGRPNLAWPSLWAPRFLDAWAFGPPKAWATRSLGAQRRRRLLVFLFNLCGPMWLLVFFLCGCSCGRFFLLWLFFVHVGVFPFLIFLLCLFVCVGPGVPIQCPRQRRVALELRSGCAQTSPRQC